jgi:two-component system sensor histidine kinase HydH
MLEQRSRWWIGALGGLGGLFDSAVLVWLGFDFTIAGRDVTLFMALFLAVNFAVLCFLIGHFMDARAQVQRDRETIARQLEELRSSQQVATQNEKLAAIGRLAAGVAHEVRNPLGVIRASASMVQESFDREDEAFRACSFICDESDRLNALISALLTFARPAEPRCAPVRAEKVIDRALEICRRDLDARGIEVTRSVVGDAELLVDTDLVSQAIHDLVTNAAEAIGKAGRIEIRVDAAPDEVRIEVADDGPGIDPENGDRLFEPFFTTKASGTGLGLAMTARIAEAHGGAAHWIDGGGLGRAGAGACFRLSFPTAPSTEVAA